MVWRSTWLMAWLVAPFSGSAYGLEDRAWALVKLSISLWASTKWAGGSAHIYIVYFWIVELEKTFGSTKYMSCCFLRDCSRVIGTASFGNLLETMMFNTSLDFSSVTKTMLSFCSFSIPTTWTTMSFKPWLLKLS